MCPTEGARYGYKTSTVAWGLCPPQFDVMPRNLPRFIEKIHSIDTEGPLDYYIDNQEHLNKSVRINWIPAASGITRIY